MRRKKVAAFVPLLPALFAACQAVQPQPRPLAVREPFPVAYVGRIEPAQPLPDDVTLAGEAAWPAAPAAAAGSGSITVRATLVELPIDEVRALLPGWPLAAEQGQGARLAADDLAARLADWHARGRVVAQPTILIDNGHQGTLRAGKRTAYVSRLAIGAFADRGVHGDPWTIDPHVAVFEHGLELTFAPERRGSATSLGFTWRQRDRVLPRPVGYVHDGRMGAIELPLLLDQTVRGDVDFVSGEALLLGAVAGNVENTAVLLFAEAQAVPADAVAAGG